MRIILILEILLLIQSCRTTNTMERDLNSDHDDSIPLRVRQDQNADIPGFLWSPSRRRASAGYFYLVGEFKVMQGDASGARNLFEASYNLDPNPFLAAKLIASDAVAGASEEALSEARKMVLLYPKSAQLHFLYGQVLARQGQYKPAVAELEEAIRFDPDNEDQYLFLADLHQLAKEYTKAIVLVKEFLAKHSSSPRALLRLAKLYLFTAQKTAALDAARDAYDNGSTDVEATLIYAMALDANGKSEKAVALYENLYRNNPANEELIGRMVELYRSLGNLEQSLELLNDMSKLPGANRAGVDLQRAILLWELRRFKEAAEILEALATAQPDQDRLRYLAGVGNERMQNWDRALYWLEAISSTSDEFWAQARLRIAVIRRQLKQYDQALKEMQIVENSNKADADTYSFTAGILAEKADIAGALEKVEQGYKKFPDQAKLLFLQGVYLERLGRYEETVKVLRKVIDVEPNNSAALNFLGYLFAERNVNLDEAEALINRALAIKANDGYYMDSLAWVFYQRGHYAKALQLLEKAQTLVGDEGVVEEHLGDVKLKMSKPAEAIEHFKAALKKNVEDKERERIEAKLKKLQEQAQP